VTIEAAGDASAKNMRATDETQVVNNCGVVTQRAVGGIKVRLAEIGKSKAGTSGHLEWPRPAKNETNLAYPTC